jgi:predicted TIM-barrel fold metal-dependent hydrolase
MRSKVLQAVFVGSVIAIGAAALVAQQQQQQQQSGQTAGGQQTGGRQGGGRGGRGESVQIQPGQECPAGTTMTRPGTCQAPQFPPPSIVDYRPRNTLVTPAHPTPKAKFPVIDYHGHAGGRLGTPEGIAGLIAALDELNVRLFVSADNTSGANLERVLKTLSASPHKDRVRMLTGISLNNVGPGWADKAIAQLEADVKAGAVGVGEISKAFGLRTRKADGSLLKIDDPDLDPVWDACARLNIPVFIHTADPQEFFEPIDFKNERWLELSLFGDRRYPPDQFPRFEELVAQRDRLFKKHPKTRFVMAHLGWHGNDLGRLGKLLDGMPNVYTEIGAVLYDIGRQPRGAREFLVKYQDRVMFGKDAFEPSEYPTYWRVLETRDEYFDYYRDYHAFWKMYGVDLPDEVLKKMYYQNALRITPGLPQTGWPR